MTEYALILLSILCTIGAVFYQCYDHISGYGSTMGGQMTLGAIWALTAIFAGVGVAILSGWLWGLVILTGIYGGSFFLRVLIESILLKIKKDDIT